MFLAEYERRGLGEDDRFEIGVMPMKAWVPNYADTLLEEMPRRKPPRVYGLSPAQHAMNEIADFREQIDNFIEEEMDTDDKDLLDKLIERGRLD